MFGKEPSKRVHPDEVVAVGAAIAADSHDRFDGAVLTDVVPTAIGIAGPQGKFVPVVARNTSLPHKVVANTEIAPGTREIKLAVYQGESPNVKENDYLGSLVLDGLPGLITPLRCAIMFTLDAECLLKVYAAIPQLNLKTAVTLVTQQTPDEVLAQLGQERIRVLAPELKTGLKGAAKVPEAALAEPSGEKPATGAAAAAPAGRRESWYGWILALFGRRS
jgi:molecular chaperone DnaK